MMVKFRLVASTVLAGILLTACGDETQSGDEVAKADPAPAPASAPPAPASAPLKEIESPGAAKDHAAVYRQDMTEILVAAKGDSAGGDKLEHMVVMKAGDPLNYAWEVLDGGDFWHEFHGHTEDAVTFYKKAAGGAHQGSLVAPFDGVHGWYFENRADKPVVVRLRTSGFYERAPVKE
jgi:hypothetical protein